MSEKNVVENGKERSDFDLKEDPDGGRGDNGPGRMPPPPPPPQRKPKWVSKSKYLCTLGLGFGMTLSDNDNKTKKQRNTARNSNPLEAGPSSKKKRKSEVIAVSSAQSECWYSCPECDKKMRRKYDLNRHMFSHRKVGDFSCSICDKHFPSKDVLTIHTRSHTGELPFNCDKCLKKYPSQSSLNRHMLSHQDKLYLCEECGKSFQSVTILRTHMSSHTTERGFKCDKCRMRFKRGIDLRRHERTHTEIVLLPCPLPQCEHQFRRKDNLIRHLRLTHNQSKDEANETFNLLNSSWKGSECNESITAPPSVDMIGTPTSIRSEDFEDLPQHNYQKVGKSFESENEVHPKSVTTSVIRLAESCENRGKDQNQQEVQEHPQEENYYSQSQQEFSEAAHTYPQTFDQNSWQQTAEDSNTREYLDLSSNRIFDYNNYNSQDFPHIIHNQSGRPANVTVIRRASQVIRQSIGGGGYSGYVEFNQNSSNNEQFHVITNNEQQKPDEYPTHGESTERSHQTNDLEEKPKTGKDLNNIPYLTRDPRKNFLWENFTRNK